MAGPASPPRQLHFGVELRVPLTDFDVPASFAADYANTVWDNFITPERAPYLLLRGIGWSANPDTPPVIIFVEATEAPAPSGVDWRRAFRYVGNPLAPPPASPDRLQ